MSFSVSNSGPSSKAGVFSLESSSKAFQDKTKIKQSDLVIQPQDLFAKDEISTPLGLRGQRRVSVSAIDLEFARFHCSSEEKSNEISTNIESVSVNSTDSESEVASASASASVSVSSIVSKRKREENDLDKMADSVEELDIDSEEKETHPAKRKRPNTEIVKKEDLYIVRQVPIDNGIFTFDDMDYPIRRLYIDNIGNEILEFTTPGEIIIKGERVLTSEVFVKTSTNLRLRRDQVKTIEYLASVQGLWTLFKAGVTVPRYFFTLSDKDSKGNGGGYWIIEQLRGFSVSVQEWSHSQYDACRMPITFDELSEKNQAILLKVKRILDLIKYGNDPIENLCLLDFLPCHLKFNNDLETFIYCHDRLSWSDVNDQDEISALIKAFIYTWSAGNPNIKDFLESLGG